MLEVVVYKLLVNLLAINLSLQNGSSSLPSLALWLSRFYYLRENQHERIKIKWVSS